ncbi:MAG: C13 family peptidase [Promethearchaeia archaeon]
MTAKKLFLIILAIIIIASIPISIYIINLTNIETKESNEEEKNDNDGNQEYLGARKAIIVCSANDFYGSEEDDFNNGDDSNLNSDTGHWIFNGIGATSNYNATEGHDNAGSLMFYASSGDINANRTLDWLGSGYSLQEYAFYNMTAWIKIETGSPTNGIGVRIGLKWVSSGGITRVDWSKNESLILNVWFQLNISGVCNNNTSNKIDNLNLVLNINGAASGNTRVFFDDIKIIKWITVNNSDPYDPNPPHPRKDSDGFPAQALQVYWILKSHGYTDDNIFLMLYHTNDNVIDIYKSDLNPNDLSGAVIDVENNAVNASRLKKELNISISGSFASSIRPEDQLIIYLVDHGSNKQLGDGNATFHFEADNSMITEFEFYNLVKNINCKRLLINIDCCFSGNFLNSNSSIGASWYNLPNCVFISASANVFSWYWIDNSNGDGWAGSWFFHAFWDALDKNMTISQAFSNAINFIPAKQQSPVQVIQSPLIQDNLGIINIWGFGKSINL